MNKKIITAVALSAIGFAAFAENDEGGMVKIAGKGYAALIDCRAQVPEKSECRASFDTIENVIQVELRQMRGKRFAFTNAAEQLKQSGANAAVFIVEEPDLPLTLSAPEAKWTLINFAAVNADQPNAKTLERRMALLFVRQMMRALGSDVTKSPNNNCYAVYSLADLDSITSFDMAVSPFMSVNDNLERLGIEKLEITTYQDACEMGLAPSPTNAVQQAIWDKVHALPTKPIKITPPNKR